MEDRNQRFLKSAEEQSVRSINSCKWLEKGIGLFLRLSLHGGVDFALPIDWWKRESTAPDPDSKRFRGFIEAYPIISRAITSRASQSSGSSYVLLPRKKAINASFPSAFIPSTSLSFAIAVSSCKNPIGASEARRIR